VLIEQEPEVLSNVLDTVVRDALPQPDPLRLRNREQLSEVVSVIVRDDLPIDDARIRALAVPLVAPEDLEPFVAMALAELGGLHEGNIARHRLRLSEFRRWRGRRDLTDPRRTP
jgi:hypothetical protein